jgi:hypothetical protein
MVQSPSPHREIAGQNVAGQASSWWNGSREVSTRNQAQFKKFEMCEICPSFRWLSQWLERHWSMKNYLKILLSILAAAICTVGFAADKPSCAKTGKNCPMNDNKACNCGKSCSC